MISIVGVGGPIGGGKSRTAEVLAGEYGGVRRSFGGVVRRRAEAGGLTTDRESLQELGDEIIARDGWDAFCLEVIGDPAGDGVVVVDGIRHVGAIDALSSIVDSEHLRVLFVDAKRDERLARLIARDGITEAEFDAAEAHPNERELPMVRARADVVIDNTAEDENKLAGLIRDVMNRFDASGFSPD